MLRLIREIAPEYIVGENVGGIISWDGGLVFEQVQIDLEAEGYEVQPVILPACAVNAPHRRDRVWFVAKRNDRSRPEHGLCAGGTLFEGSNNNLDSNNPNPRTESLQSGENGVYRFGITADTNQFNGDRAEFCASEISQFKEAEIQRGTTSDPNINTAGSPGESGCLKTNGGGYNDEQEERRSTTEQYIGSHELLRDATNSQQQRLQESKPSEQSIELLNVERDDSQTNADTFSAGRKECNAPDLSERSGHGSRIPTPDWSNFPTQPPVCSRNDGVSPELAGITVSKHRNESIKAYGNAIVPQVVYQIFKAIQEYETLRSERQP